MRTRERSGRGNGDPEQDSGYLSTLSIIYGVFLVGLGVAGIRSRRCAIDPQ